MHRKDPVTLIDKLFSSVPKREYAVQNINLALGHAKQYTTNKDMPQFDHSRLENDDGVILLVGRSASGKSTILRLLANMDGPKHGCLEINGQKQSTLSPGSENLCQFEMPSWMKLGTPVLQTLTESEQGGNNDIAEGGGLKPAALQTSFIPQPVILERKPDFDNSMTVMERIVRIGNEASMQLTTKSTEQCNICKEEIYSNRDKVMQTLARDFVGILGLSGEQCTSRPSGLSPSGQYLFGLACACMVSVSPAVNTAAFLLRHTHPHDNVLDSMAIPYPILLLDELFDAEAPSTVEKCSRGMLNLIKYGGVVVSATHRPGYFTRMTSRIITLSGGKVLLEERQRTTCIKDCCVYEDIRFHSFVAFLVKFFHAAKKIVYLSRFAREFTFRERIDYRRKTQYVWAGIFISSFVQSEHELEKTQGLDWSISIQ
ncbi:hypothetical protein ACHAXS_014156 [Conticribra weissflogii]